MLIGALLRVSTPAAVASVSVPVSAGSGSGLGTKVYLRAISGGVFGGSGVIYKTPSCTPMPCVTSARAVGYIADCFGPNKRKPGMDSSGDRDTYSGCVYSAPPARFSPQGVEDLSAHALAGMRLTGLPIRDSHGKKTVIGRGTDEWQSRDGSKWVHLLPVCLFGMFTLFINFFRQARCVQDQRWRGHAGAAHGD